MNRTDYQLCGTLQKLDLFRGLDLEDAQSILTFSKQQSFKAGEEIWKVGDPSPYLLVLLSGHVEMRDRKGAMVADLTAGTTLGEMSSLNGHPRFRSVRATRDITALSLGRHELKQLWDRCPEVYRQIIENALDILAHRLSGTEHRDTTQLRPGHQAGFGPEQPLVSAVA